MKKTIVRFPILVAIFILFTVSLVFSADKFDDRGKYIYDEVGRLPLDSKLALSSYLWKLDAKTNYEIILVFPKTKLDEKTIIGWFNQLGVGKKGKDNGAAVFIFPDNSGFVSIGSGNDKVSVAYSKTEGERIFRDLAQEPVLTLLRFASALGGKINEPSVFEMPIRAGEKIKNNLDVILLWALAVSLIIFLIQQINGFQKTDLIIPLILLGLAGLVVGAGCLGGGAKTGVSTSYEFGIITETKHDEYHYVTPVTISTGKSTITIYIPHTDYRNYTKIVSYDFKPYAYRFVSTDSKSAWTNYTVGTSVSISVDVRGGGLYHAGQIGDFSGGKTIGDGVWINQK